MKLALIVLLYSSLAYGDCEQVIVRECPLCASHIRYECRDTEAQQLPQPERPGSAFLQGASQFQQGMNTLGRSRK